MYNTKSKWDIKYETKIRLGFLPILLKTRGN